MGLVYSIPAISGANNRLNFHRLFLESGLEKRLESHYGDVLDLPRLLGFTRTQIVKDRHRAVNVDQALAYDAAKIRSAGDQQTHQPDVVSRPTL